MIINGGGRPTYHWPLNGNFKDEAFARAHLIGSGSIPPSFEKAPNYRGIAPRFDGAINYPIKTDGSVVNMTADFSALIWMKCATAAWAVYPVFYGSREGNGFLFHPDANNTVMYWCIVSSGGTLWFRTINFSPINQWRHLAITFKEGMRARFYLDGRLYDEATSGLPSRASSAVQIWLGRDPAFTNRIFNGWLRDAMIFNRELAPAEVNAYAAKTRFDEDRIMRLHSLLWPETPGGTGARRRRQQQWGMG